MLDKRCRYKVRELSKFYLFIKHKSIYYAYYPNYKVTRSTGETELQNAYKVAWNILATLQQKQNKLLYKPYTDKKRQRDLKHILSYLDQSKPVTKVGIAMLIEKKEKKLDENMA